MNKVVFDQTMIAAINWLKNVFKKAGWNIDISEYDVGCDTTGLEFEFISITDPSKKVYSNQSIGALFKTSCAEPIQDTKKEVIKGYIDTFLFTSSWFRDFLTANMTPENYNNYTKTSFAPFVDRLGENKKIGLDEIGFLIDLINICDRKS